MTPVRAHARRAVGIVGRRVDAGDPSTPKAIAITRRHVPAAALSILAAVLLAACGGGGGADKGDYEAGMRKVNADIAAAGAASTELDAGASLDSRKRALAAQAAAISKAAKRARGIEPPEDARKDHDRFVTGLEQYGTLLDRLGAATGDSAKEAALLGEIGPVINSLTKASTQLEEDGYDFGSASSSSGGGGSGT